MIKKYNVTVNGRNYQVELEEVKDGVTVSAPKTTPAPAPAQKAAPAQAPAAKAPEAAPASAAKPAAGATVVSAPMPGTILSIKVKSGDTVKRGDILLILEAMKMENEILAAADGTVAGVHIAQGASVNTGDALISMA